jgi:hypothetical protein
MKLLDAQTAVGYVQSNLYNVETTVYQTKYPSFDYAAYLPIVTEGAEWAVGTTFYSGDIAGTMEWFAASAFDVPNADVSTNQFIQGYHTSALGFQYNLEEISRAQMAGRNLTAEKGIAARKVAERFAFYKFLQGDPAKGMQGLFNYGGIPTANAAATGTGSSTLWASKTQDQILADINAAIIGIYNSTLETEMADTIVLPTSRWLNLSSTARTSQSDTTTLNYLERNNVYTAQTGQPLRILASRLLATAGNGGTARLVAYRRDPEVLRGHLPMPYRIMAPEPMRALTVQVPGIMRIGGTEIRLPNAVTYLDNI